MVATKGWIAQIALAGVLLVQGCGNAGLAGGGTKEKGGKGPSATDEPRKKAPGTKDDGEEGGSTEDSGLPPGLREHTVSVAADTAPSRVLFVLDNSQSMGSHAKAMTDALLAIEEAEFPKGVSMGVITSMAGHPKDLTKTHPDVSTYEGIAYEPGFLKLFKAADVETFIAKSPKRAVYEGIDYCAAGWFTPFEKTPSGRRCFEGALRSPFHGVGCEAALLALKQTLAKHGQGFFGEAAQAHVVFLADEYDGCASPDTTTNLPKADELKKLATASGVAALKLHGIIPTTAAALPYKAAIEATGGKLIDIKTKTNDYKKIVEGLFAEAGKGPSALLLPEAAQRVEAVLVDGTELSGCELAADGITVKLPGPLPLGSQVVIRYAP